MMEMFDDSFMFQQHNSNARLQKPNFFGPPMSMFVPPFPLTSCSSSDTYFYTMKLYVSLSIQRVPCAQVISREKLFHYE